MATTLLSKDYSFLKRLLVLAVPFATQELLVASLQIIDTMMIGRLSVDNVAAVNLANQPFFIFILLLMGITSGATIFASQYWGQKDIDGVGRSFGMSLSLAMSAALAFAIATFFGAESIMRFYTNDANLIAIGTSYMKIIAPSYLFSAATLALSGSLRSTKQPKIPLMVSMIAVGLNTILNYALIFGKWGAPAMGVEGAALGTIISRGVEVFLIYAIVYGRKNKVAVTLTQMYTWPKGFFKKYLQTSFPVILNDVGWVTGFSFYNKIYASIGSDAITAVSILGTYTYLFIILFLGTGHATAVILGNHMGEGNLERAKDDGEKILLFTVALSVIIGFVVLATSHLFALPFHATEQINYMVMAIAAAFALSIPFKVVNIHVISGILRSGGDTNYGAFLDIWAVWGVGVPIAAIAAYLYGLELPVVYALVLFEEVVKALLGIYRMSQGKWLKTLV